MSTSLPLHRPGKDEPPMVRLVTGRTVLGWMVAFFAVVFAANAVLVTIAVGSFPGLHVASSYRAGQEFNGEVAAAAAQAARGWNVDVHAVPTAGGASISAKFADKSGAPERLLSVTVALEHLTDTRHDRRAELIETAPGVYAAEIPDVASASWMLVVEAFAAGERVFRSRNPVTIVR